MKVSDIKDDAKQVLAYCDDATLYNRLTHAIEVLANKGQWDAMTAYMDITVQSGNTVVLPREVEIPLKININTHPSFSRARIYEFSMNGPGNDMKETLSYNWLDKGEVAVLAQPVSISTVKVTSDPADNGKFITISGRDSNNVEQSEKLTLNSSIDVQTTTQFKEILRVFKDVTAKPISIKDTGNNLLSTYYPDETEPIYRKILLSKAAPAIRMLFRRRTYKIASDEDYIPLQSQMAILMMLKSLELFRNGSAEQLQQAPGYEEQALKLLKEEQDSRNAFNISQSTETPLTLDLNYNNADSIIVADIYDEAAKIFGNVGRQNIFDSMTDAIELLNNKGNWDGLTGYVDIVTDNNFYVTLPRYIESVIALTVNGEPKQMRNKWFEFHLNGPGVYGQNCEMWDDAGETLTTKSIAAVSQFIAQPDLVGDDGNFITIYGYDENLKWIRTQVGGAWQDGFQVTLDHTGATPAANAQKCSMISRIIKDTTTGFVKLSAYDPVALTTTQMGYYYPDETEPRYQRIKLPYRAAWVRMRYRKRSLKITSLTDPIHLKSKLSIIAAMRAVAEMMADQPDFKKAQGFESVAVRLLLEEQDSRNPAETFDIQFSHQSNHQVII